MTKPSQQRRQSDRAGAAKSGRRWSDHVEIELVGSDDFDQTSGSSFVTTAFAAQVLGQFTHRPSPSRQTVHHGQAYQLHEKTMSAGSERLDRVVA